MDITYGTLLVQFINVSTVIVFILFIIRFVDYIRSRDEQLLRMEEKLDELLDSIEPVEKQV
ncbi:hypothetical protein [Bacillus alkalicellulosilyticus]|uniref:hypothetical protein n=1 Tax=Alkalihalobacterium alkalicellulosilyticum TaxID=1912214 RepID=UPI000995F98A|nr:hypothetical protein [Bacillus alkalicellulosilyticus]